MLQLIKSIPLTFYSSRFYVNLIRQGSGIGMAFILLHVLLSASLMVFLLAPSLSIAERSIEDVFSQFPDITIKNQQLSMTHESPDVIRFATDPKAPTIVFDTTSPQSTVEDIGTQMSKQNIIGLVTADFVAVRNASKTELYYFKDYKQLADPGKDIHHDQWMDIAHTILVWGIPLVAIVTLLSLFAWRILATLLQSLFSMLFALAGKVRLNFAGAMRLSAAASIPVVAIEVVLKAAAHISVPFFAGFLLWFAYIVFALVSVNKSARQPEPATEPKP